ncbi:MAG: hypothetical protein JJV99_13525 [Colwellia sp.]|nr:hypothetical protein [Colwellia sp.]
MAVINCPHCKKKISNKVRQCNYCSLPLTELDTDKVASLHRIVRVNQKQRLINYSFIAMLLFCGGFLFMFWNNVEQGTWQYTTAMTSAVIGFIMYIVIRVRLLFFKYQN